MRVEKAYYVWGGDFGTEYMLFDAGLEKFIDLEKKNFVAGLAVLAQKKPDTSTIDR